MPLLPNDADFIGDTVDEATFKAKQAQMLGYLRGLLGNDGTAATALTQLGINNAPVRLGNIENVVGTDGTAATARQLLGLGSLTLDYIDRGAWATNTLYHVNDQFTQAGIAYLVTKQHTSTVFSADAASGFFVIQQGLNHDTGLQKISGVAALRTITPTAGRSVYCDRHSFQGDGGHGVFRAVTGKPVGYFLAGGTEPDDNGTIIVPTGGDGSAAWVRETKGVGYLAWFGVTSTSDSILQLEACNNSFLKMVIDKQVYISRPFFPRNGSSISGVRTRLPNLIIDNNIVPFTGNFAMSSWDGGGANPDDIAGGATNNAYLELDDLWVIVSNISNTNFIPFYSHLLETSSIRGLNIKVDNSSIKSGLHFSKGGATIRDVNLNLITNVTCSSYPIDILVETNTDISNFNYAGIASATVLPSRISGSNGCSFSTFNIESRSSNASTASVLIDAGGEASYYDWVLSSKINGAKAFDIDYRSTARPSNAPSLKNIKLRHHPTLTSATAGFTTAVSAIYTANTFNYDLAYLSQKDTNPNGSAIFGITEFSRSRKDFITRDKSGINTGLAVGVSSFIGTVVAAGTFDIKLPLTAKHTENYFSATLILQIGGRGIGGKGALLFVEFGKYGAANAYINKTFLAGSTLWNVVYDSVAGTLTATNISASTISDVTYKISYMNSYNYNYI